MTAKEALMRMTELGVDVDGDKVDFDFDDLQTRASLVDYLAAAKKQQ